MFLKFTTAFFFILCFTMIAAQAQTLDASGDETGSDVARGNAATAPAPSEPYKLTRGTNEFGVWGGGAFSATSAFGGLKKDEARDRHFVIAAFRYGRTLAANDRYALQYTFDVIPLALATGNLVGANAKPDPQTGSFAQTARRETTYGAGFTPLGFQVDFSNSSRIKPFVHFNAGMLFFTQPVPLPDGRKFVFTLEGGTGVRIFTSERRAVMLGVRLHHISDANRGGSNRGLNQFIFYSGFSIFK